MKFYTLSTPVFIGADIKPVMLAAANDVAVGVHHFVHGGV